MADPTVLAAALVSAGSVIAGYVTVRQNRRGAQATNTLDARKVDLEEFREVQARNEKAIERADQALQRADARMEQLEQDLAEERSARERAEKRAESAEDRATRLEQTSGVAMRRLIKRVEDLEARLRAAGLNPDAL